MGKPLASWPLIFASIISYGCATLPAPAHQQRALEEFSKASEALADFWESELPLLTNLNVSIVQTRQALQSKQVDPTSQLLKISFDESLTKQTALTIRMLGKLTPALFGRNGARLKSTLRDFNTNWSKLALLSNDAAFYQQFILDEDKIEKLDITLIDTVETRKEFSETLSECGTFLKVWEDDTNNFRDNFEYHTSRLRNEALAISHDPNQPVLTRLAAAEKFTISLELPIRLNAFLRTGNEAIKSYCDASIQAASSLKNTNYTLDDLQMMIDKVDKTIKKVEQLTSLVKRIAALLVLL